MSKHLVTGVCGFVGSHLARRLLAEGHQVYGVDSLVCGFAENIDDIIHHKNFLVKISDINTLPFNFLKLLGGIDYTWHLAARGETYWCRDNPEEALRANVHGTLKILDMAKNAGCRHFFFSDTSAEYDGFDDDEYFPTAEWMAPNTITPMGYYSITKMCASQFIRSFGKKNNMGTTLFRYFNVYGPSMNLERDIPPVIGSFTSKLLRGEKPIIYGTGEKSRDFIHIDDVTNFHMCALVKRRTKTDTQTYNVGTGERHTIKEVYVRVYIECKEIDSDVCDEIDYRPNQLDEAETTLANIEKAKEELGWQPEVSFDDGVKLTVQSLSKMMGAWNEWKKN